MFPKGALATLTRNTAFALLKNKIRVNQLNIGWMGSDGEHQIQTQYHGAEENWLEKAGKEQPSGRLLSPEEVSKAVSFLASDDSGMMTGSVINFDQSVEWLMKGAQPSDTMKVLITIPDNIILKKLYIFNAHAIKNFKLYIESNIDDTPSDGSEILSVTNNDTSLLWKEWSISNPTRSSKSFS